MRIRLIHSCIVHPATYQEVSGITATTLVQAFISPWPTVSSLPRGLL